MYTEHITIIHKSIQINGYFAHCENILLSMLADYYIHIRMISIEHIIKSRKLPNRTHTIYYIKYIYLIIITVYNTYLHYYTRRLLYPRCIIWFMIIIIYLT